MRKGFFITATDTGAGKTVVSGAIIAALKKRGIDACGMKPIETGCGFRDGRLYPADGAFLRSVSGVDVPLDEITPFCFESALSPLVASEIEKSEIDRVWLGRSFERLSEGFEALVVEGIGGLMVPILDGFFVVDLALELSLPAVIVTSPFLGTINHTLLTVERALRAGLEVAGVVINRGRAGGGTLAEETNPGVLRRLLPVPVIGDVPYYGDFGMWSLADACGHMDMAALGRYL